MNTDLRSARLSDSEGHKLDEIVHMSGAIISWGRLSAPAGHELETVTKGKGRAVKDDVIDILDVANLQPGEGIVLGNTASPYMEKTETMHLSRAIPYAIKSQKYAFWWDAYKLRTRRNGERMAPYRIKARQYKDLDAETRAGLGDNVDPQSWWVILYRLQLPTQAMIDARNEEIRRWQEEHDNQPEFMHNK